MNRDINWYSIPKGDKLRPFNFIIGGRGIGKSFSAVDTALNDYPGQFLYLRNTGVQLDESCSAFGNPFKKWSKVNGRDVAMKKEGDHAVIYEYAADGSKILQGYGAALSVFSNLRSVDLSDVKFIIYEEFIEKRMLSFDQFGNFKDMYETVNRNRELEGEPPVYVVLLSNAQRLGNPILRGYDLIPVIEGMQRSGQRVATIGNKRIELPFSEVSEMKRKTALYENETDDYTDQALNNNFSNDSFTGVKKVNLTEYTPMISIDGIYIYKHKSEALIYACSTPAKVNHSYRSRDHLMLFMRIYGTKLKLAYSTDKLLFSDYSTKVDLMTILGMLY